MELRAEALLREFAQATKKDGLTADDRQLFYQLAIHVHQHAVKISGLMLRFRLMAVGVPQERAERLGAEFDRYGELLARYDRHRL
jgi:hypothetical protein